MPEHTSAASRSLVVDPALLEKYQISGPRYASYPSAERFGADFHPGDWLRQLAKRGGAAERTPVSVYVHLPFCDTVCYYCACNMVVTRERSRTAEYLAYLEREIVTQRGALGRDEEVAQLQWGGGTPTFFSVEEMSRLMDLLRRYFVFLPDGEYSIEIDTRRIATGTIEQLGRLGFNRLSLGVQDFDSEVQKKINRIQSAEDTARAVIAARASGFDSVSFDLVYGLPAQSAQSVAATLETVLRLRPDRIALHNYAHLPALFAPQRRIDAAELPSLEEMIRMLTLTIDALTAAGYAHVGMDQFALPDDDLAQARGVLERNFQGNAPQARYDLLAFGVSAIAAVGDTYSQNHCRLEDYYGSLERGELPVFRGHRLDLDDLLRREIIRQLACGFRLSFEDLGQRFGIDFRDYFAAERARLVELEGDGLIESTSSAITVTARGRLLVRVVCMAFDRYLRAARGEAHYSKAI